jgi:hypothetical protein
MSIGCGDSTPTSAPERTPDAEALPDAGLDAAAVPDAAASCDGLAEELESEAPPSTTCETRLDCGKVASELTVCGCSISGCEPGVLDEFLEGGMDCLAGHCRWVDDLADGDPCWWLRSHYSTELFCSWAADATTAVKKASAFGTDRHAGVFSECLAAVSFSGQGFLWDTPEGSVLGSWTCRGGVLEVVTAEGLLYEGSVGEDRLTLTFDGVEYR